jgi:glucose-6-phosphate dehydrogenase assembly protein OpcA
MEDAVTSGAHEALLPLGREVPFCDIELALGRPGLDDGKRAPGRALTATIVVVGPHGRLAEAAESVEQLTDVGVRAILISDGANPAPTVRVLNHAIAIEELRTDYLNNAVAALRLSSLPTVVWWRGGNPEMLDGLADLADRLVFDAEDPTAVWARATSLAERTATSDLRWARLTRWRALMAQFFDIPEVQLAARSFTRFMIQGADAHAARLYAGWLASSLGWTSDVAVEVRPGERGAPLERIEFGRGDQGLTLVLGPSGHCVQASAHVEGHAGASRVVSLGDQRLTAIIGEELRIRSRDLAFERAVAATQGVA